jgi:hypothetical protein
LQINPSTHTQATSHGGALRNAATASTQSPLCQHPEGVSHTACSRAVWLAATLREAPLLGGEEKMPRLRLHVCLLCARGTAGACLSRGHAGRREGKRSSPSPRSRLCLFDPRTGRELELALLLRRVLGRVLQRRKVFDERLEVNVGALRKSFTHSLRNDTYGAFLSHRECGRVSSHTSHSYRHQCAAQPKLWSVSSLASSAFGASSPPSDGLPQRSILLVRGVRARRGGVAREGEARSSERPTRVWLSAATLGCRGSHYKIQKRSSVCFAQNGSSGGLQITPRPVYCFA